MDMSELVHDEDKSPRVSHRKLEKPNPTISGTSSSTTLYTSTHRVQLNQQDNIVSVLSLRPHARVDVVPNQTVTIQQFQAAGSSTRGSRRGVVGGGSARDNSNRRHHLHGQVFNVITPQDYQPPARPRSSKRTISKASGSSRAHERTAGSTEKTAEKEAREFVNDLAMIDTMLSRYARGAETEATDRYYRIKVVRGLRSVLAGTEVSKFGQIYADISESELRDFMDLDIDPSRDTIAKIRGVVGGSMAIIERIDIPKNRTRYKNKFKSVIHALDCLKRIHGYTLNQ
ncbi:hypothetical protein PNOK_0838600 [Pyrrhoderma noxium]|uniref:Uncharacterized protein n=1 Tax=Pyrrhoderma noxium TaxID=2282107 RepID=A0A286UB45_9AGAM|nr:hypothetical protein PNOK_0838600 [Pyrrhoderma noxium]